MGLDIYSVLSETAQVRRKLTVVRMDSNKKYRNAKNRYWHIDIRVCPLKKEQKDIAELCRFWWACTSIPYCQNSHKLTIGFLQAFVSKIWTVVILDLGERVPVCPGNSSCWFPAPLLRIPEMWGFKMLTVTMIKVNRHTFVDWKTNIQ